VGISYSIFDSRSTVCFNLFGGLNVIEIDSLGVGIHGGHVFTVQCCVSILGSEVWGRIPRIFRLNFGNWGRCCSRCSLSITPFSVETSDIFAVTDSRRERVLPNWC
jgi:hypothetical protein